ncbi:MULTISPECIES: hypothetical protein [unclassified Streptomyces]|uniref:hypothetical protein n=1 Tax=unclassified Streptomyces TaxID=2593676 RepID=UPI002E801849|nr:hypothetical protein [Streptomyces sp. NBC_00589]WTI37418.1 hypothetical protein OIC96_21580 [Streptomyces sp. NBC_00775]WUB28905.1 hypothetical protein OHA51_28155 [Streptomyces sp. NBC_00589]
MIRTKGRACTGKRRHDTREEAEDHRGRLIAKGGVRLTTYLCRNRACGGWHVGHLPKPRT